MIESFKSKNLESLSKSLIFAGAQINLLPETLSQSYSVKISDKLSKHPNTMLQYSPGELYKAMMEDRAVVAINETNNQLMGFAQLWKYSPGVWEFGSWISFVSGIGKPILLAGSLVGYQIDPEAQIIAIVEKSNKPAKKSIENMGWKWIGQKYSNQLVNPGSLQPASMDIYDVSFKKFIHKAPPKTQLILKPENYQLPLDL